MFSNLGMLAGRTVFISGAGRGIGKAIALTCARDAAKMVENHSGLSATIFTSAKDGTLVTDMKRFTSYPQTYSNGLSMNGTHICSKCCIYHPNASSHWSKNHVAAASTSAPAGSDISDPDLSKTFDAIKSLLQVNKDLVQTINAVYVFDLKDSGSFFLDLKNGSGSTGAGAPAAETKVDVTMTLNKADFVKMFAGQMNPTSAFMTGRLKIKGDLALAMKLEKLMKKVQAKL